MGRANNPDALAAIESDPAYIIEVRQAIASYRAKRISLLRLTRLRHNAIGKALARLDRANGGVRVFSSRKVDVSLSNEGEAR